MENTVDNINSLPREIIIHTLSFLYLMDILKSRLTCKNFNEVFKYINELAKKEKNENGFFNTFFKKAKRNLYITIDNNEIINKNNDKVLKESLDMFAGIHLVKYIQRIKKNMSVEKIFLKIKNKEVNRILEEYKEINGIKIVQNKNDHYTRYTLHLDTLSKYLKTEEKQREFINLCSDINFFSMNFCKKEMISSFEKSNKSVLKNFSCRIISCFYDDSNKEPPKILINKKRGRGCLIM